MNILHYAARFLQLKKIQTDKAALLSDFKKENTMTTMAIRRERPCLISSITLLSCKIML